MNIDCDPSTSTRPLHQSSPYMFFMRMGNLNWRVLAEMLVKVRSGGGIRPLRHSSARRIPKKMPLARNWSKTKKCAGTSCCGSGRNDLAGVQVRHSEGDD